MLGLDPGGLQTRMTSTEATRERGGWVVGRYLITLTHRDRDRDIICTPQGIPLPPPVAITPAIIIVIPPVGLIIHTPGVIISDPPDAALVVKIERETAVAGARRETATGTGTGTWTAWGP